MIAQSLIGLIELDPWIDGVHKFSLSMPPVVINLYDNRRWRISYHIVDGRFVAILEIGRVT